VPAPPCIVDALAFAPELHSEPGPFTVHTRWIETEFHNDLPPWSSDSTEAAEERHPARRTVTVEVDGKRLEVTPAAILATSPSQPDAARPARSGPPRTGAGRKQSGLALRERSDGPHAGNHH
jgi:acetyl-CoA/propionyl-CoA carboxylase biotin carboxyl carrier protein